MELAIIIILIIVLLGFFIYLISLKKQIKQIKQEIVATRKASYNRQISVSLFDRDLTDMTMEINRNLDYQKKLKLEHERAERQMKQSVSDIAHDLRTPLTVIKGNLQMLEKEESFSEESMEYLRISREKTDVLRDMVDDFFELSVLESDQTEVELQPVSVNGHLMEFLVDHETVIRDHGLTPVIHFPEKDAIILADEKMLDRMLGNLLNNVLKYAKNEFEISVEMKEQKIYITFSNRIPDGTDLEVEHLFDRSYQGDKARKSSGAGLGLYIVKLLAEKQGAEVFARRKEGTLELVLQYQRNSVS